MKINEKNLCAFATYPPYDLVGWLNKRGDVNKPWQRRYFVLKGNLLFYFEKKGDKEPLGLIVCEGCTIELCESGGEPYCYCFQMVFSGNRSYFLSAESQENLEIWMKALTCAGYEYKKLVLDELQRQLEEFELNTDKRTTDTLTSDAVQSVAPKPPPRRQNPFNRPAPPPPINPNLKSGSDSGSVVGIDPLASASTTVRNMNRPFTIMGASNSNNSIFYGQSSAPSTSSTSDSLGRAHSTQNINSRNDEFNFDYVHRKFAEKILNDINSRKKLKPDTEKPLIEF